jgi:hypothetical protein
MLAYSNSNKQSKSIFAMCNRGSGDYGYLYGSLVDGRNESVWINPYDLGDHLAHLAFHLA